MFNLRFYISWILGAVVMYSAFYCWHGMILTDLSRISYPRSIFLVFAAITYLVISFGIYKVFQLKLIEKVSSNLFLKAVITGVGVGFLLFVLTTVLGLSFSTRLTITHLVTDCVWQILEQTLGASVVALVHLLVFQPDFAEEEI